MELTALVHEVGPEIEVSDKFKKRELIVEYAENPQYPEYQKFEVHQAKTNILDGLNEGDQVKVFFNIKGKPWTNREGKKVFFTTLVVWKIEVLAKAATYQAPQYIAPVDISSSPEDDDDLPF